jgi:hypothetical protein
MPYLAQIQETIIQELTTFLKRFPWIGGHRLAYGFGKVATAALPNVTEPIMTYVSDGLHFRRGIREFLSSSRNAY